MLVLAFCICLLAGNAKAEVRWHLDFEAVKLDRISIRTGMQWSSYWYLVYKVSNKTDRDIPLRLSIKATSDVAKKTYLEGYYKRVEEAIELRDGKAYQNIKDLRCNIDQGDSKLCIAIFGSVVESTDTLKIQVRGLWDRVFYEGEKVFVEDRALVLTFLRPGDEYFPQYDKISLKRKEWVVLSRKELTR